MRYPRTMAMGVAVALAAVAGCATAGVQELDDAPDREERDDRAEGTATLEVRNYNWSDVHVYVISGGQRRSLGLVTSHTSRQFILPRTTLGTARDLFFMADPIGSPRVHVSHGVFVQPGDRVEWMIQNNLAQSSISVF